MSPDSSLMGAINAQHANLAAAKKCQVEFNLGMSCSKKFRPLPGRSLCFGSQFRNSEAEALSQ